MQINKPIIFLAILMAFQISSFAQKSPIKFGKITDPEIQMTVYDKDTSASAVILADYGTAEIRYSDNLGFQLYVGRHKRIKILKNDGLDWAKGSIRLYRSSSGKDEDLTSFKASTYNIEGSKLIETKFPKKDIITEQESKNYILKKYALPNVKIGSIIEVDYSTSSPFYWILQDWYFQDEIPVVWCELRTIIPEFFDFRRASGGYVNSTINEETSSSSLIPGTNSTFANQGQRIVFQDIPAFKNEQFITTPKDYLAKVEYELRTIRWPNSQIENYSSTWEKIAQNLLEDENFGLPLDRHGIVKELTEQINISDTLPAKIEKAVQLIKKQLKWDETYDFTTNKPLREAFNKGEGNMAEVNLLLINLLRSVGIDANPVLFSTRKHGTIRQFYPMSSSFNGVLASVKINGKDILIDGTLAFYKPGELPYAYINGNGMKITKKGSIEWIPLLNNEQYSTVSMASIKIEDGKLKAEIVKNNTNTSASELRSKIAKKGKQQFIDDFIKETSDWDIKEYKIENESELTKPVAEKIIIDNFNQLDASGDMIYIPSIVVAEKEINPFISDTRLYPIDFGVPMSEKNILNIAIPDGYDVEELPTDLKLILPDNAASFAYMARKNGNNIQVSSTFKISRTKYNPSEYQLLKEFYKNMISKHGEQIVLKKL
jgi:hypothetical protein